MNLINIEYREIRVSEVASAASLVSSVFSEFVSPQYSSGGIDEFFRYANADEMKQRLEGDYFILIAVQESRIIGMIEVRSFDHISLLFVDSAFQRRGIGKELIRHAIMHCNEAGRSITYLTVNSSPNAVDAYRSMGFHETDCEQEKNGIRFVPMKLVPLDPKQLGTRC